LLQGKGHQNGGANQHPKKHDRVCGEIFHGNPDEKVRNSPGQTGSKEQEKGFSGHNPKPRRFH
jgi:hypothetical protein